MRLMTIELRKRIPKLYSSENLGADTVIQAKFFTPDSSWTWYVTEFDGEDTFFGIVHGHEIEMGYFSLSELESIKGPLGLSIERDLYFTPVKLRDFKKSSDSEVHAFIQRMYNSPEPSKAPVTVQSNDVLSSTLAVKEEKNVVSEPSSPIDYLGLFEEVINNI